MCTIMAIVVAAYLVAEWLHDCLTEESEIQINYTALIEWHMRRNESSF